jgi:cold shock CspA family protein
MLEGEGIGVVKRWIPNRGFGFISTQSWGDLFCHASNIANGAETLPGWVGARVKFRVASDVRSGRQHAVDVQLVD